ncbi:MAG: translation initiation factor IF-2 [Desulfovibrio sp.]|uniref:translation initiation factor IF-2 n=1 Tax=Desulfovibrio sp. TaxID=885 RepID=UPI0039E603AA
MPWEWIAAGIVLLVVVVFCIRLMKSGITTLEDERALCDERIRTMEEQVRQDQKNMPSSEHLYIALAGLRDMLRLADYPSGFWLEVVKQGNGTAREKALMLRTPDGDWRISLIMRERQLRAVRKVAHGQGRWHLYGAGVHEEYADLPRLMCALHNHLRRRSGISSGSGLHTPGVLDLPAASSLEGGDAATNSLQIVPPEKEHLARRFSRSRGPSATARKKSPPPPPLKLGSR